MTTATTGTGTITLGSAVSGYLTFALAGVANSDVISYAIKDGANSEIGTGTYTTSGTTLTRTVTKSTNSNSAISLSGTAEVFITPRAEDLKSLTGYFLANRTSNQTGMSAATSNRVQFSNEVVDGEGWFDNATNFRYQPKEAGYYFFSMLAGAAGNSGGTAETCQTELHKNGSTVVGLGSYFGISSFAYSAVNAVVPMNGTTDYLEGFIYLPTGVTSMQGGADRSYLFGWKVGN